MNHLFPEPGYTEIETANYEGQGEANKNLQGSSSAYAAVRPYVSHQRSLGNMTLALEHLVQYLGQKNCT